MLQLIFYQLFFVCIIPIEIAIVHEWITYQLKSILLLDNIFFLWCTVEIYYLTLTQMNTSDRYLFLLSI